MLEEAHYPGTVNPGIARTSCFSLYYLAGMQPNFRSQRMRTSPRDRGLGTCSLRSPSDTAIPGKETHNHGPIYQLWAAPSSPVWETNPLFLLKPPGKVGGLCGWGYHSALLLMGVWHGLDWLSLPWLMLSGALSPLGSTAGFQRHVALHTSSRSRASY